MALCAKRNPESFHLRSQSISESLRTSPVPPLPAPLPHSLAEGALPLCERDGKFVWGRRRDGKSLLFADSHDEGVFFHGGAGGEEEDFSGDGGFYVGECVSEIVLYVAHGLIFWMLSPMEMSRKKIPFTGV